MTVLKVIDAYNAQLSRVAAPTSQRRSKNSAADRANAARYLRWCRANDVDPVRFIEFRFQYASAVRHPLLSQLASSSALDRFRERAAVSAHERDLHAMLASQPLRDLLYLNHGQEAVRRNYTLDGRPDLCEVQPSLSGGYHPESQWCPTCPRASSCRTRVNRAHGIDVVALRSGALDVLPREVAARIPDMLRDLVAMYRARGRAGSGLPSWVRAHVDAALANDRCE